MINGPLKGLLPDMSDLLAKKLCRVFFIILYHKRRCVCDHRAQIFKIGSSKFSYTFLWAKWYERTFSSQVLILPSELFDLLIAAFIIFWGCDIINFLNYKPERVTDFYHIVLFVDHHKLCFSSINLGITIIPIL